MLEKSQNRGHVSRLSIMRGVVSRENWSFLTLRHYCIWDARWI